MHPRRAIIALALLALAAAATFVLYPLLRPVPLPSALQPRQPKRVDFPKPFPPEGSRFSKPFKQTVPEPIHVGPPIAGSYVVHTVNPVPPSGLSKHLSGEVIVRVVIDHQGRVESAKVVGGHPLLYSSTLDAVRQWRFRPFLLNGLPIKYETDVIVQFR